jgi:hypothetical protein
VKITHWFSNTTLTSAHATSDCLSLFYFFFLSLSLSYLLLRFLLLLAYYHYYFFVFPPPISACLALSYALKALHNGEFVSHKASIISRNGVHPFLHLTTRLHVSVFQKFGLTMHPLFFGPLSHQTPLSRVHATQGFFHFGSPQSTFSCCCCCSFASDKDNKEPFRKKKAKKKKKEKKEREDERAIVLIFIYIYLYSLRSL